MKYSSLLFPVLLFIASCSGEKTKKEFIEQPTALQAELFMPGVVSTGMYTRDIAMTPDGNEIYFCVALSNYTYSTILVTSNRGGRWSRPEVMAQMTDPRYMNIEPAISPDGNKFFFVSNRPRAGNGEPEEDTDIWIMDREGDKWGEPYNPGMPLNTMASEFFPSVVNDGSVYFTLEDPVTGINQICYSHNTDGRFEKPVVLPPQVNAGRNRFNAFADRNENFIIVPAIGMEDSFGSTDYYISFRNDDGTWREPVNMGSTVNTAGGLEYSPYVSPSGDYFYFMSVRLPDVSELPEKLSYEALNKIFMNPGNGNPSVYRIDAGIIDELSEMSRKREEFAFITYVSDSIQERAAARLVRSIRERAGIYRRCTIYVILGDKENFPCKSLAGPGIRLLPIEMDRKYLAYPLAYKAFACAQVEQLAGKSLRTLAWFDPSTLVLKAPAHLDLSESRSVAFRPVTLVNSIGETPGSIPGDYWKSIYDLLDISYENVPTVKTIADTTEVRAYYNCEIFSFDPSKGICSKWKDVLSRLLDDNHYQGRICVSPLQKLFLHQAVLSGVITAYLTPDQVLSLPLDHAYPAGQHKAIPSSMRLSALDEVTCLILDYINEKDKNWLSSLPVSENLSTWLQDLQGK